MRVPQLRYSTDWVVLGFWLALATGLAPRVASAQDEVVDSVLIQPAGKTGRVRLKGGNILDYNADWLYYQGEVGGETQRIAAAEVVEFMTRRVGAHERARRLFEERDFEQARVAAEEALRDEKRAWVRREILALLVRCHVARGRYQSAGDVFLALIRSQPRTRFAHRVPLAWAPGASDAALRMQAVQWLGSEFEWERLLGASHLLDEPEHRESAFATMQKLSAHSDRRLGQLARAQSWRVLLAQSVPSDFRVSDWQADVRRMEPELRGGAYYLLGRAHTLRHEYDQAAVAFLWVPFVYDDDDQLAARSLLEAADAVLRTGQRPEAQRLYREVTTRFAHTTFAADARSSLSEIDRSAGQVGRP